MCRWTVHAGEPVFLEQLVLEPSHSLIAQSLHAREAKAGTNGDGFGLGWYGERREPGLYREILPAWSDCNLRSLCRQLRSRQRQPRCSHCRRRRQTTRRSTPRPHHSARPQTRQSTATRRRSRPKHRRPQTRSTRRRWTSWPRRRTGC